MFPLEDDPLNALFKSPPNFQLSDPPHHQNPTTSKHDDDNIGYFFSSFPSPFFDEHELPLNQILPKNLVMTASDHHHQIHTNSDRANAKKEAQKRSPAKLKGKANDVQTGAAVVPPSTRRRSLGAVPKRKAGKKDRHSKISTAQGIRDRRMRLSLQVARKFFDLQDMLGYDKASKTIEWLFSKSKKAIKDLIRENNPQGNSISLISDAKSESFVSECEVMSGIDQENSNIDEMKDGSFVPDNETPLSSKTSVKDEKKPRRTVSKPDMRESREKARARARCRTRQKLMNKGVDSSSQWYISSPNCDDLQKLGSANNNPFEAESGSIYQERVSSYGTHHDNYNTTSTSFEQQMADVGTIEKLLGTSGSSSTSCPISEYYCSADVSCCVDPNTSFMRFLGNWDLLNNDRINSVTDQVSLPGNPNSSDYSVNDTPNFPFYQH